MQEHLKHLKFIPTIPAATAFLVLMLVFILLFFGRNFEWLRPDFITAKIPEFYTHVSNLSLSFLIISGVGYLWLMLGAEFKYIFGLVIFTIFMNFLYELFIPVLNTLDLMDAYYGLTGSLFGALILFLIYKFGLQPN